MSGTDEDGEETWLQEELAKSGTVTTGSPKRTSLNTSPKKRKSTAQIIAAMDLLDDTESATQSALDKLSVPGEVSQADEHRYSIAVHYPGYNPVRPYPLPMQRNKQLKVRSVFEVVLKRNEEGLRKYGVRQQIKDIVASHEMRCFFRDAFWWLFLEFFVGQDFDAMVLRAKKNIHVSDLDYQTFLYGTGLGVQASVVPKHRRKHLAEKRRTKVTKEDFVVPSHVCMHACKNRQLSDVANVGSPRSASVDSLSSSLATDFDSVSDASSMNGEEGSKSPSLSRASSVASDMSSDDMMRVSKFPLSHHRLNDLNEEVRDQIVMSEQHRLFTRMSSMYAQIIVEMMPLHFSIKDSITRLLPDLVAQAMYYAFARSLPYALHLLDAEFQAQLGLILNYWMGGVEHPNDTKKWPIQQVIYPHLQKKKKKPILPDDHESPEKKSAKPKKMKQGVVRSNRATDLRDESSKQFREALKVPILPTVKPSPKTARPQLSRFRSGSMSQPESILTSRASSPKGGSGTNSVSLVPVPPSAISPRNDLSMSTPSAGKRRSIANVAGNTTTTAQPQLPQASEGDPLERSVKKRLSVLAATARRGSLGKAKRKEDAEEEARQAAIAAKKEAMFKRDTQSMKNDLRRMITTHTFSQAAYTTQNNPNSGLGKDVNIPKRLAHTYAIGPKKRTVQVIKDELDQHYRDVVPWYNNRHKKIPVKEQLGASKFSLNNWSPLLHRFMLMNGEENRNVAEAMSWTT